eukprot:Gb_06211 [translate_table: standard]
MPLLRKLPINLTSPSLTVPVHRIYTNPPLETQRETYADFFLRVRLHHNALASLSSLPTSMFTQNHLMSIDSQPPWPKIAKTRFQGSQLACGSHPPFEPLHRPNTRVLLSSKPPPNANARRNTLALLGHTPSSFALMLYSPYGSVNAYQPPTHAAPLSVLVPDNFYPPHKLLDDDGSPKIVISTWLSQNDVSLHKTLKNNHIMLHTLNFVILSPKWARCWCATVMLLHLEPHQQPFNLIQRFCTTLNGYNNFKIPQDKFTFSYQH